MLGRRAVLLCCLLLPSSSPAADADALIDRMMNALGGREAIGALGSLAVEADCTGPDGEFRTRVESLRPGSVYFRQAADGRVTELWSTPERTWRADPEGGTSGVDAGVRPFLRGHEFHLLLFELESRFSSHRRGDAVEVGGRSCRKVEMEDDSGHPAAVCIDESDGTPLMLEMNPEGAAGPIRIHFTDWREVEGLRYFHAFELTEGPERTFTYRYRILVPDGVDPNRFAAVGGTEERQGGNGGR
ncbi:MAG: hypothetical protein PVF68_15465 [Acidobacteriota bacterium]|jgi:hypothetical protein